MTGIETKRLKTAMINGHISKEMLRKEVYIDLLLEIISTDDKLLTALLKRIK